MDEIGNSGMDKFIEKEKKKKKKKKGKFSFLKAIGMKSTKKDVTIENTANAIRNRKKALQEVMDY